MTDQLEFISNLRSHLIDDLHSNFVFGGDFNTVLSPALDKKGGRDEGVSNYRAELLNFIEEFDLVDIWRLQNPDTFMHTWYSKTPLIQCRLDFWLTSSYLTPHVTFCKIKPSIKTDHSLISLQVKGSSFTRRDPGFWKFNSSLLKDETFVTGFKDLIWTQKDKYFDLDEKKLK